jgi:hypothetical protein
MLLAAWRDGEMGEYLLFRWEQCVKTLLLAAWFEALPCQLMPTRLKPHVTQQQLG